MVSREQYTAAVSKLLRVARMGCGGSSPAAQVLLSADNGNEWQVSIPDLCVLDPYNFQAALVVISGRYQGFDEPHELIPDGQRIFEELCADWKSLENRRSCR